MSLQLVSADYPHADGMTYRIRRDSLEQDFTIEEKQTAPGWIAAWIRRCRMLTSMSSSASACWLRRLWMPISGWPERP